MTSEEEIFGLGAIRANERDQTASELARGLGRSVRHLGMTSLTEFSLRSGRRVDLMALDAKGHFTVIEIKSSLEDFRSDKKWQEYLDYCDAFYFAVPETFPKEIIPGDVGLMVADAYGATILRESACYSLAAARRRALLQRFAETAAKRLHSLLDPH
ncbi:MAG: MmcB family DNA repair protein [Pseudomonadota bacterium]